MKLNQSISVKEIAELINAKIIGDSSIQIDYISEIHKVRSGSLTFVDNEKYYNQSIYSSASAIIIDKTFECPKDKVLLVVDRPFKAYNYLAKHFSPFTYVKAQISDSAIIGKNTIIEPGVIIGNQVTIGDDCHIRANTVLLDNTKIGNKVIVNANCSIGNDAFYYKKNQQKKYEKWHSIGSVIIEDHVEIGANCTIDKGVSSETVIGEGTKIDNSVHIGHGVRVGRHCLIAAQTGIAGKTIIQDYVTIYGQVGISKSLVVGEGATILAKAGVPKSIPGGNQEYFGIPAGESRTKFRELIAMRQLPELITKVNELYHHVFKKSKK